MDKTNPVLVRRNKLAYMLAKRKRSFSARLEKDHVKWSALGRLTFVT